jgi:hypothetical protein
MIHLNRRKKLFLKKKKKSVLFITFADQGKVESKYSEINESGLRLISQAKAAGVFSETSLFNWDSLSKLSSLNKLIPPDTSCKFLFKPYLIRLFRDSDYDFIFYADAGCEIVSNPFARFDFYRMLKIAERNGIYAEGTRYLETSWSRHELIEDVVPKKDVLESGQVMATFFVLGVKGRERVRVSKFIDEFFTLACKDNFFYLRDQIETEGQYPEFIDTRHDQSIMSILLKKSGFKIQSEKRRGFGKLATSFRGASTFLWVTRNRSGNTKLPKNINNKLSGLFSFALSPLLNFHFYLQNHFSLPTHYCGFEDHQVVKVSKYPK